ncbi:MAG: SIS domain-containing protein [Candidatus Paceibacterota bacterium]
MYEEIKNFNKQFSYEPKIENQGNFIKKSSFIVIGMGGSALAQELLKNWKPELDIVTRRDYGLPELPVEEFKNKLIILSSYSGNTEEVISAFNDAKKQNLNMAVVTIGGKLLSLAKENNVPYIQMSDTGIQPRMALGFSIKAFLKLIGEEDELEKINNLTTTLSPLDFEKEGKALAEKMKNYVPIIYASGRNLSLASTWKIKINEAKVPAFYNIFPALNHNEMTSFDVKDSTKELINKFYFIFLKDTEDSPKILKRMEVTEKLYKDRGLQVEVVSVQGENFWQKMFSVLVLGDWVAYYLAIQYGLEPEQVPMVEEFKKLIS